MNSTGDTTHRLNYQFGATQARESSDIEFAGYTSSSADFEHSVRFGVNTLARFELLAASTIKASLAATFETVTTTRRSPVVPSGRDLSAHGIGQEV